MLELKLSPAPVSRNDWHPESMWLLILSRPFTAWLQIGQVTAMVSHKPISRLRAKRAQCLIFSVSPKDDITRGQLRESKNVLSEEKFEMTGDAFVKV